MNQQLAIWQLIRKSLEQNVAVMLLYVLESKGSSPGRQGFFMAVAADGAMEGSIGGGIMEHKFVEMARKKLNDQEEEISVRKQIHDKSAAKNQSGMICSGEQTVLLYRVQVHDFPTIEKIILCLENNRNGLLQLTPAGIQFSNELASENDYYFVYESADNWLYEEKVGLKNQLHIIGGGHCALAFSKLMYSMDFYIHMYDDRTDLNTFKKNKWVHEKTILNSYSELKNILSSGSHQYVVIMTLGYRTDDVAFRALWNKEFAYLGMLGSQHKIDKMFSDYRSEGMDEALLKKIHAPVGLSIHSQTPWEIAVSIAAEIIQVKNSRINEEFKMKNEKEVSKKATGQ